MCKIIIFEGPDFSGKSTIAKELARRLGFPYYKNSLERVQKIRGETREMAKVVAPIVIDLLRQMDARIVMDRFIASEFVYAQVDNRPFDLEILKQLDDELALLNTITIICYKTNYAGYVDESTPEERLPAIIEKYRKYTEWSKIEDIIWLDTTNYDIDRQISDLLHIFNQKGILV